MKHISPAAVRLGMVLILYPLALGAAQAPDSIDFETAYLDRMLSAVRTTGPIVLDGRLDEPDWSRAEPATDFIQRLPDPGLPSPERTEVYFLYDENTLYVGFVNFDSRAQEIRVNDLREDFAFRGTDSIGVVIDSLNDRRSGFLFGTSPVGAKRDSQISNDGNFNDDWDGVWDVKVTRNDEGWIAEFAIPFRTLRFSQDSTQEWGVNMNRRIMRLNEESAWAPLPVRYSVSRMSIAGRLSGLDGISQGRNLTLLPYVSAGFNQARARNGQWRDDYDGGVDLKYGLTPSLTLDATFNTDFAQTEVDTQQVNLTRFSLFFPEKRDFFLENSGTFGFGPGNGRSAGPVVPFFSRRIGLNSRGTQIPILGGGRVSGQIGRYDIGFLAMRTDALDPAEDPDLDPADQTPSNNFLVGRVKRNLLTNSWIGAIWTHRDSTTPGDTNRVYGADARFQFFSRLNFVSYLLRSQTPGRVGNDQARQFEASWNDDELGLSAGYITIQPNFNPEVGFVRRRNMTQYDGEASWNPLIESSASIRNLRFETGYQFIEGAASGEIETRDVRFTTGVQFQNNGAVTFTTRETFERLGAPFNIRSGIPIPIGDHSWREHAVEASSDPSRVISGGGRVEWGGFWNGDRTSWSANALWKPHYRWSLDTEYTRNRVTLPGGEFTTDLMGARFNYGFSPYAFINAFFQYNADTNFVSSNIRFNWTHSPLSDLFIVYNDVRDTDTGELADRSLVLKLTNLFSF